MSGSFPRGQNTKARFGREDTALADLLRDLADKPEKLASVEQTLVVPPTLEETVTATRRVYERLLADRAMPAAA